MKENKKYFENEFTEMFSPKSLEHFVLPKRIKDEFPNGELISSKLLFGSAGCGKSSLAKFIGKQYSFYYVNSSLDTSKSLLEDGSDIYKFCSEFSFDGKKKVVMFDEIDGVSQQFFSALKGFMDTFGKSVKFLATTNNIDSIPEPILSRFGGGIDYASKSSEEEKERFIGYRNRLYKIIKYIGMDIDKVNLEEFSRRYFPDFRYPLKTIQRLKTSGIVNINEEVLSKKSFEHSDLYSLILETSKLSETSRNSTKNIHTFVTALSNPSYVIKNMDVDSLDFLDKNDPSKVVNYANIIIIIARYNDMLNNRVDAMICLKALVFQLVKVLKSV